MSIEDPPGVRSEDPAALAARALARAVTVEEVIDAIFEHTLRRLGGLSLSLWLVDAGAGTIRFGGGAGYVPGAPESVDRIPLHSDLPAALVIRSGQPLTYSSVEERNIRWPELSQVDSLVEAVAVLPLDARNHRLGCMSIGFTRRTIPDDELGALGVVAEQCALALDRAVLYDRSRRANETLELLAEGTALMVSSLDPDEVLGRLVQLAVPRFADSCAVFVPEGRALVGQVVAVADPGGLQPAFRQMGDVPMDAPSAVTEAFRHGEVVQIPDVVSFAAATNMPDSVLEAIQAGRVRRGVAVPLQTGGETLGVMTIGWGDDRPTAEHDEFILNGLAARAAIALANARQFRRQRDTADFLAAALLPTDLTVPAGIVLATRFVPASGVVAGDWFDALTRPDGMLVFGIGDAAGHGLPAVTVMAELRNAARGLAIAGMPPGKILEHLSVLVSTTHAQPYATAFYATLDPSTLEGRWATAGHLPPLIVAPGRPPEYLTGRPGMPLGVSDRPSFTEYPLALKPGSKLVAISDGVIERRDQPLDYCLDALADAVGRVAHLDAGAMADHILGEFCSTPEDDCCVLILQAG